MKEPSENNEPEFDIAIIGAGITGSVASISLQSLGYKIAIIERTNLSTFKQGESLAPECKRYFHFLGLNFSSETAIEYSGNSFVWGEDSVKTNDFIFNPYGNGLSIDKTYFEQQLMAHAKNKGVIIFQESKIVNIIFQEKIGNITLDVAEEEKVIKARFIIFATGRKSCINTHSSSRRYFDKLIALTFVEEMKETTGDKNWLYIEATPNGWFYTNTLPNMKRIFSFFTDNDLIEGEKSEYFKRQILKTRWVLGKGLFCTPKNKIKTLAFDARTYWADQQSGECWLKIGDSAYTIDPLSGQGIIKNLEMIDFCTNNIKSFLDGDIDLHKKYGLFNKMNFIKYQSQRKQVFKGEERWRNNEFWNRRTIPN